MSQFPKLKPPLVLKEWPDGVVDAYYPYAQAPRVSHPVPTVRDRIRAKRALNRQSRRARVLNSRKAKAK